MTSRVSVQRLTTAFLDLLFPLRCLSCGSEGSLICSRCRPALPRVEIPFCQRCGTPLPGGILCPACISSPLSIDGIRSAYVFEGTVRQAIHQLKYRHLKTMAVPLGELLADYLRAHPLPADVLVPVPLHRRRLRARGYNQAFLLAKEIGALTGLPVDGGLLVRHRDSPTQARTASAAERRSNVRGAFASTAELKGERVLLIDDVCTTGATLDACASVLKGAGAASVWGLTVASEMFRPPAAGTLKSRIPMA